MQSHKSDMNKRDAANLIDRFLRDSLSYPQEWNDFVETSQKDKEVDSYRKICLDLDPLVNTAQAQDVEALDRLRDLADELRGHPPK